MKLTPAQFREALGISQETLRHWRKALPIFQGRKGYGPAFSPTDLIAGAIVKLLRDEWGISVAAFADGSVALRDALNDQPWSRLPESALHLSLTEKSCEMKDANEEAVPATPTLVVPLAPFVEQVTAALLRNEDTDQTPIYFPPVQVGLKAARS
ncbi:hypothetical protein DXV76_20310 [Rhodobacteraceae bacterium CCMM004]|nr:hypothetical protein DXV76_20310 [Rhodobacteraceae bacterium CCMM004]